MPPNLAQQAAQQAAQRAAQQAQQAAQRAAQQAQQAGQQAAASQMRRAGRQSSPGLVSKLIGVLFFGLIVLLIIMISNK
jgi:hypothetical protein